MKRFISLISVLLGIVMLFSACKKETGEIAGTNSDGSAIVIERDEFKAPEKLMTTEEYQAEIKRLLGNGGYSAADDAYIAAVDALGDKWKEAIVYSTNDITECTGTKYYVSAINGNDENDGKSPETAWATIDKLNKTSLKAGDLVLFQRGGLYRGQIEVVNGVTYSAFGTGYKPKICNSIDLTEGEWVETDTPNVWRYDQKMIKESDLGVLVYDFGKQYCTKVANISKLKSNNFFCYNGGGAPISSKEKDNMIYVRCDEGNPKDVYKNIEITKFYGTITLPTNANNIKLNNLDLFGGIFFNTKADNITNITMEYCTAEWSGGKWISGKEVLMGGGGGGWKNCDNVVFDHCYINQQCDSGVTAQYDGDGGSEPGIFKNFITKNCMFENCEYTFECFQTEKNNTENCYDGLYFGYNLCRKGGYGFGDKPAQSAYLKMWDHENTCYNSTIEYNIFDRGFAKAIHISSYEQTESGNKLSYDVLPTVKNNVYIHKQNRPFATLNNKDYKYSAETYNELNNVGFDIGSAYKFVK